MSATKAKNSASTFKKRLDTLEQELHDVHQRCAIISLVADILAERGIVTETDIENHVRHLTERLQQQARSEVGVKAEELPGNEGLVSP